MVRFFSNRDCPMASRSASAEGAAAPADDDVDVVAADADVVAVDEITLHTSTYERVYYSLEILTNCKMRREIETLAEKTERQ